MDSKNRRHILVVDDDAAMRKVLSLGLEKSGFDVSVARDGREALDALDSGSFDCDCVLLDIRMPVMTGREALPHIKKRNPTLPVLMLTAFNDLSNGIESMRDGAFDYLVKPVRLEELLQAIERAFSHRALLMENAELGRRNEEYRLQLELRVEARTMELNEAYVKLRRTNMETVKVLAETIEAKDQYTRGHCQRVRLVAVGIAKVLGLSARHIEILEYSSLLHDIGKIGIPESLLNKCTKLEPEEFEIIRQHPATGAQILSHVEFFAPCLPSVRQHHERWDGHGYPDRLSGEAIDPLARIIAVGDSFDAMASNRPYRNALPIEKAISEIASCKGSQFAPDAAEAFLDGRIYEQYPGES